MIYFVRHGQTEYNAQIICAGQQDIPLSAIGLEQARQTAIFQKPIFQTRVLWCLINKVLSLLDLYTAYNLV